MTDVVTDVVTMYDTIGSNAGKIPADARKVAGYLTGSAGVPWSTADWARFPHAGHVTIDQSPLAYAYAAGTAHVLDIEQGAGTIARFLDLMPGRKAAGHGNCPYGGTTTLQQLAAALDQTGSSWHGMHAWLANPSLTLAQATDLIGTELYGFNIQAVQWATPRSNPALQVPGGTLGSLSLDVSVAAASWHPAPGTPAPVPWQATALDLTTQLADLLRAHQ